MMYKVFICLIWVFASAFLNEKVFAEDNDDQIVLVTGDNYFPFVTTSLPDGGWSNAIVKSVFKEMGYVISIDTLPWSRGEMWTQQQRYLGTFPYVFSDKRDSQYFFSKPINYVPIRIFTARQSGIREQKQLIDKKLCLPHGYLVSHSIKTIQQKYALHINRAKDTAGCFGQVARGWSDIGLINGYFNKAHITDVFDQPDAFVILPEPLNTVPLYFIVARSYPGGENWIKRFDQALTTISQNGQLSNLNKQYISLLNDSYFAGTE